jgi:hypothetical protein
MSESKDRIFLGEDHVILHPPILQHTTFLPAHH